MAKSNLCEAMMTVESSSGLHLKTLFCRRRRSTVLTVVRVALPGEARDQVILVPDVAGAAAALVPNSRVLDAPADE